MTNPYGVRFLSRKMADNITLRLNICNLQSIYHFVGSGLSKLYLKKSIKSISTY